MNKIVCRTEKIGKRILFLEETDSTNLEARRHVREEGAHGLLVIAGRQTAGRGRRGRSWHSSSEGGIFMSLLLKPECRTEQASMLTLVAAEAAAEAAEEQCGQAVGIKWPNDLVMRGRKVCGILTEMTLDGREMEAVIIGIGLNVNMTEFPSEVAERATSLRLETGRMLEKEKIIGSFLEKFEKYYTIFLEDGDLKRIRPAYEQRLVNKDEKVRILDPGGEYEAHALGITPGGQLLVKREDGSEQEIFAGEVSVRGVYGYV